MPREGIHPTFYPEARLVCSCGTVMAVGSTQPEIRTDVCSACHPFYTGEQRIVDTAGQVDRFMKRLKTGSDIRSTPRTEKKVRKPIIETADGDEE
ncbi:MAG TPA: 50S ribosomal protein L31 [Ardenticatenaceae bacterium]